MSTPEPPPVSTATTAGCTFSMTATRLFSMSTDARVDVVAAHGQDGDEQGRQQYGQQSPAIIGGGGSWDPFKRVSAFSRESAESAMR